MNQKTKERNDNGFTRRSDVPAAPQGNSAAAGQSGRGEEKKGGGTAAGGRDRGTDAAGQKKAAPVETACQHSFNCLLMVHRPGGQMMMMVRRRRRKRREGQIRWRRAEEGRGGGQRVPEDPDLSELKQYEAIVTDTQRKTIFSKKTQSFG